MDDEVLGCGGTIARHVSQGDEVVVCVVANRAYDHKYDTGRIDEEKASAEKARKHLGYQRLIFLDLPDEKLDSGIQEIIIPLEEVYREVAPEIVYICHHGDINQDHRAVFEASMVVLRPHSGNKPRRVLSYEVPSSTDQAFPIQGAAFQPNFYVDISEQLIQKLAALGDYEVELRQYPHPRSPEGIDIYAKKRGIEIGMKAAEAFVVFRDEWPS